MFNNDKRFEVIYTQGLTSSVKVYRDTHTGVAYLSITDGYGGGLCPLLNPDGTPMVYFYKEKENEN